ncbi:unnamed protein product [Prorocentrum cordatum]|uniref:Cathepsin propeptide inhibitor domain-containing protein n=1 Tax=Prorocentrum cordatum TaxID=2364126 RepID=A0ABN9V4M7_9DINO|nr:unnamed protein product [Polarella glacialis]
MGWSLWLSRRWFHPFDLLLALWPVFPRRQAVGMVMFPSHEDFPAFVERYGRSYEAGTFQYQMRQSVYAERAARISSHNCRPDALHTAGVNHLSDWTPEELATLRGHRSRRGSSTRDLGRSPFLLAKRGKGTEKPVPQDFSWGHLASIRANSSEQETLLRHRGQHAAEAGADGGRALREEGAVALAKQHRRSAGDQESSAAF